MFFRSPQLTVHVEFNTRSVHKVQVKHALQIVQ